MIYFQAMCYKNLRKYDKAKRDYGSLLAMYNRSEHSKILQHVTAMIILPLQKDRRVQDEFMENTLQLVRHF